MADCNQTTNESSDHTLYSFFYISPFQVPFFEGMNVGQLAAGLSHSMALTADGTTLYAWGRSDYGQLGIGGGEATKTDGMFYSTPQRPHGTEGVVWKQIAVGEAYSMALTLDEELYTWGFEGVTGHGGNYLIDTDCKIPRLLELDNMLVHSMSGGAQHGVFLASPKPQPPSPSQPESKRRKMK